MNKMICPKCGSILHLNPLVEKAKEPQEISVDDVLKIFPPKDHKHLEIEIHGNMAHIRDKAKFNRKRFNMMIAEVRGYGGRYVKGYFEVPIAGLMGEI